jgi:hypothetical protein
MTEPNELPRMLDLDDLMKVLPLSRSQLYWMMQNDKLPTVPVGRRRFVPLKALEAWIANGGDDTARRPAPVKSAK